MGRLSEYDEVELKAMGWGSSRTTPLEDPRDAEIEHDYDIHHDPGDEDDCIEMEKGVTGEELKRRRHRNFKKALRILSEL